MKLKYCFEMMELEEGLVAVPVGNGSEKFHGVLKVNETAADILKLLEADTTEEQIVNSLMQEYSGDRTEISNYVHEFIYEITAKDILE